MRILNTYHVPVPVRANASGAAFLAVLTEGAAGDKAVYVGIAGDLSVDSPDYKDVFFAAAIWIAHHGLKLKHAAALAYFPNLNADEYRD